MQSIELFSGCGGLALGTARACFEHLQMVEWNSDACATLAINQMNGVEHAKTWRFSQQDVREIDWKPIGDEIALVAGGSPCQPFSIGGKHSGKSDARDMWPEAVRAIRELEPKAFLFENVRGLARPAFEGYLNWITYSLSIPQLKRWQKEDHASHLARLKDYAGRSLYKVTLLKVNAADFGAAQKRHRVIIAGIRKDLKLELSTLNPSHSRDRLLWDQWIEGSYWVRHKLKQPPLSSLSTVDRNLVKRLQSCGRKPAELPWRTVRDALLGLGDPNGRNGHVFQAGARVYPGHTGSPLDEPAKALKAGDHGVPGGENMMVKEDGSVRYFTIREAARLQGFPDDWSFNSSWTETMRQLGNAVPVQFAETLGEWISRSLSSARIERNAA